MRRSLSWFLLGVALGAATLWVVVTLTVGWHVYAPVADVRERDHYVALGCEPQMIGNSLWMKCPRRLYWLP